MWMDRGRCDVEEEAFALICLGGQEILGPGDLLPIRLPGVPLLCRDRQVLVSPSVDRQADVGRTGPCRDAGKVEEEESDVIPGLGGALAPPNKDTVGLDGTHHPPIASRHEEYRSGTFNRFPVQLGFTASSDLAYATWCIATVYVDRSHFGGRDNPPEPTLCTGNPESTVPAMWLEQKRLVYIKNEQTPRPMRPKDDKRNAVRVDSGNGVREVGKTLVLARWRAQQ